MRRPNRFSLKTASMKIAFLVAGNGGHHHSRLCHSVKGLARSLKRKSSGTNVASSTPVPLNATAVRDTKKTLCN